MLVETYTQKGNKKKKKTRLPKDVFGVELNSDLVYQVAVSQMANRRQKIAHTKDRSEKRGGGRKPWRQKGTGRARHGSIRSPIWIGGGVTFGPRKDKNFKRKIPKKAKRKALLMVLSNKAKHGLVVVLDKLKIEKPKTQKAQSIIEKLPCSKDKCLIVLPEYDKNVMLAVRNLPNVGVMEARNINALALLSFKYLLIAKDSIKVIEELL